LPSPHKQSSVAARGFILLFGWFRKKEIVRPTSEVDRLLALPDIDFADLCARTIRNEGSGANAMVVVAYANMQNMFPLGIYALEKERRKTNAAASDNNVKANEKGDKVIAAVLDEIHPFDGMVHRYDDVFRLIFEKLTSPTDDEINRRRHESFLRALLLYRLMQKASANPSMTDTVVEIWATLASSGQHLKSLLEHNIIWSEGEKVWFADVKDANDGVRYVVNLMVPKCYRVEPTFQEIAKKHQFCVSML